jgi:hypothetical protein
MTPNFKYFLLALAVLMASVLLTGCGSSLAILDGATHAKGSVHIEGFSTDSEADIDLCKVPKEYTADEAKKFCDPE